jgi:hypothetical protein
MTALKTEIVLHLQSNEAGKLAEFPTRREISFTLGVHSITEISDHSGEIKQCEDKDLYIHSEWRNSSHHAEIIENKIQTLSLTTPEKKQNNTYC